MNRFMLVLAALLAIGQGTIGRERQSGDAVALRAAQETETIKGDLKAAIEQYHALAKSPDRAVAAEALVRMAGCHQKLGNAEARAIYERVVREYADQAEAVRLARTALTGLPRADANRGDRAVWTGDKVDMFGRVSPDGAALTYVDWGGRGNLVLHDLVTGRDRDLTSYDGKPYAHFAESSTISADGREVAYVWGSSDEREERREIRRLSIAAVGTSDSRRVYAAPADVQFFGPLDWSEDKKWIATSLQRRNGTGELVLISVADGSARVLKQLEWRGPERVFLSPDSKYLAFDVLPSSGAAGRDIHVIAIETGRETAIVEHPASDGLIGWSNDGRQLLFGSDRTGTWGIWMQAVVDGEPKNEPEMIRSDVGPGVSLGISRSGTVFMFRTVGSRDVRVARLDLAAGRLLESPRSLSRGFVAGAATPSWSPDGRFLAYQACDGSCVAIRSTESGEVRTLQGSLLFTRDPRWAPDGKSVVVAARNPQGQNGIFRMDVETGSVTRLVDGPGFGAQPQWSPDGAKLYYFRDGSVIERDSGSGVERAVVNVPAQHLMFELSPDGSWLALGHTEIAAAPGTARLTVVPVQGGPEKRLAEFTEPDTLATMRTIVWAPDGRSVLAIKRRGADVELWQWPLEGTGRKFEVPVKAWFQGRTGGLDVGFTLSRDGTRIAFLNGRTADEVWAFEGLTTLTGASR